MYRAVTVELVHRCGGCAADVPVVTADDVLACGHCPHATPLPWRALLDVEARGHEVPLADALRGLSDGATLRGATPTSTVALVLEPARCPCGAPFTDAQLGAINRLRPTLTCAACGATTPARRPPAALGAAHPHVIAVLGEGAPPRPSRQGVVLACGGCGAPLPADGDTPACTHCGATNLRPPGAGPRGARGRFVLVFRV